MSKGTWKGKPLEDCTKAELIVAVMTLGDLYQKALVNNQRQMQTFMRVTGLAAWGTKTIKAKNRAVKNAKGKEPL